MILICGSTIDTATLPEASTLGYQLIPDKRSRIFIKTSCNKYLRTYVRADLEQECLHDLPYDIRQRCCTFKDDDDLRHQLEETYGKTTEPALTPFEAIASGVSIADLGVAEEPSTDLGVTEEPAPVSEVEVDEEPVVGVTEEPALVSEETSEVFENADFAEFIESAEDSNTNPLEHDVFDEQFSTLGAEGADPFSFDMENVENSVENVENAETNLENNSTVSNPSSDAENGSVSDDSPVDSVSSPLTANVAENGSLIAPKVSLSKPKSNPMAKIAKGVPIPVPVPVPTSAEIDVQLDGIKVDLNTKSAELNEIKGKYESVLTELQESKTKHESLVAEIEKFKQESASKTEQVETLKSELEVYQNSSADIQAKIAELTTLKVQLQKANMDIDVLTKKLEESGIALKQKTEEVAEAVEKYKGVIEDLRVAKETLTEKNTQLTQANTKIQTLTAELDAVKNQCAELVTKLSTTEAELATAKNVVPTVDTTTELKLAEMTQENLKLQDIISELQDKIFTESSNTSSEDIAKKDEEILELQSQTEKLSDDIANWTQKYNALKVQMDKKVNDYESKLASVTASGSFLKKYEGYTQVAKAMLKEGLSTEEAFELTGYNCSNVTIMSFGVHDSMYTALSSIASGVFGKDVLVVNCTCDMTLSTMLGLQQDSCNGIDKIDVMDVSQLVQNVRGTSYIPCDAIHDVLFLRLNWGSVLAKLQNYARGRQILILLGSVASFPQRYVASKLGSIPGVKNYLVLKGNPYAIRYLYSVVTYFPVDRISVVVTDCIETIQPLVRALQQTYRIAMLTSALDMSQFGF